MRAVLAYLDRQKMQARGLSPTDVMNAIDNYNLFLPTGDAKFGDTDYAIDSNSMYDFVDEMGDIPLRSEQRQRHVSCATSASPRTPLHPDEHRARQRPPAGLHSRLPPTRGQHAERGRSAQDTAARDDSRG